MRSHRTIWRITAVFVVLAAVVVAARENLQAREAAAEVRGALSERDARVTIMMTLLERDARVRRPSTQGAVEAVSELSGILELRSAEVYYALGLRLYYGQKDLEGAEGAYQQAVALRPDWAWPHNGLGILWFARGEEERGLAAFREAIRLAPQWSRPHSDLAILYRRSGRMEEATRQALTALELDPEGPVTHYNYGVILDVLGKHGEAKTRYESVVQRDPTLPSPYYNLACGYARKGIVQEAIFYLEKAISLDEAFRKEPLQDPDFDPIRGSAELKAVIEAAR